METFTKPKPFVDNPLYGKQKDESLASLDINTIDAPIVEIIRDFAKLPHCFTLQSCYGHFLYDNQREPRNVDPLTNLDKGLNVEYRIAYIALCIQNSETGLRLFQSLGNLTVIDPEYVQFGCAEWFWERQVNSYAVQVEPERYKTCDKAIVSSQEALYIEEVRNQFFDELRRISQEEIKH
jgi:hypothetical protein